MRRTSGTVGRAQAWRCMTACYLPAGSRGLGSGGHWLRLTLQSRSPMGVQRSGTAPFTRASSTSPTASSLPVLVAGSERLGLMSGSAIHERSNFGGQDVALVADNHNAVAVFDAVGGWHSIGGSGFAQAMRTRVRQLLSTTDHMKQELITFAINELTNTEDTKESGHEEKDQDDTEDLSDVLYDPSKDTNESNDSEGEQLMKDTVEELRILSEAALEQQKMTTAGGRRKLLKRYTVEQLLPREILLNARSDLMQRQQAGVSTALLLILSEKPEVKEWEHVAKENVPELPLERQGTWLHSATMGDPCFLVIRKGKKFYRSTPSYLQFNEPHHFSSTTLSFAMDPSIKLNTVNLEKGDIIVAGTNGLFDNMWDHEIVDLVMSTIEANVDTSGAYPLEGMADPELIADALVNQAAENSTNVEKKSPFAEYAEKEGYLYVGGREDDITATVSFVVPRQ